MDDKERNTGGQKYKIWIFWERKKFFTWNKKDFSLLFEGYHLVKKKRKIADTSVTKNHGGQVLDPTVLRHCGVIPYMFKGTNGFDSAIESLNVITWKWNAIKTIDNRDGIASSSFQTISVFDSAKGQMYLFICIYNKLAVMEKLKKSCKLLFYFIFFYLFIYLFIYLFNYLRGHFFLGGGGGGGRGQGALKPVVDQCLFSGFDLVKLASWICSSSLL